MALHANSAATDHFQELRTCAITHLTMRTRLLRQPNKQLTGTGHLTILRSGRMSGGGKMALHYPCQPTRPFSQPVRQSLLQDSSFTSVTNSQALFIWHVLATSHAHISAQTSYDSPPDSSTKHNASIFAVALSRRHRATHNRMPPKISKQVSTTPASLTNTVLSAAPWLRPKSSPL